MGLRNVLPKPMAFNSAHGRPVNMIRFSYFRMTSLISSYFGDYFFGYLRATVRTNFKSSLLNAISNVRFHSTQKQMKWVNTGRGVTSMENTHSFWNNTSVNCPSNTVSTFHNSLYGEGSVPISFVITCPNPQPTTGYWFHRNILFKSLLQTFDWFSDILGRHLNPPCQGSFVRPWEKRELLLRSLHIISQNISKYKPNHYRRLVMGSQL